MRSGLLTPFLHNDFRLNSLPLVCVTRIPAPEFQHPNSGLFSETLPVCRRGFVGGWLKFSGWIDKINLCLIELLSKVVDEPWSGGFFLESVDELNAADDS